MKEIPYWNELLILPWTYFKMCLKIITFIPKYIIWKIQESDIKMVK